MTDNEKKEYLIVTMDSAFKVKSIEEAIYAYGIKSATVFQEKINSKNTYKYLCNIILDEDCDE